jgi:hypothetical protein
MMAKKRIFKTDFVKTTGPANPETLFHNLRGRAPEIKHLWSHQADLLRDYHQQCLDARDVAMELPTGAGKTLVGLLIAEWRRQSLGARVAYLCPTRQLARQVGAQAFGYGIQAHVLVGKQRDYPPQEFSEYQSSRAIAVTTYSAVFNINPRIKDAQTLILDDAHAGENFMVSMWSVEISRSAIPDAYYALVELLRNEMDSGFYADIADHSDWDPRKAGLIELVAGAFIRRHADAIRDLLDENLEEKTSPWYVWNVIKSHLAACNFFISWDSILIRPFIPPTQTHAPFEQASQRVYMSATLGAGGELERITGVKSIKRLPLPAGWDKRGSGRRLFLIPELAMSNEEMIEVVEDAVQAFDRSLILVPSRHDFEGTGLVSAIGRLEMDILHAPDIEDSIEPFLTSKKTVLLLSRYDGLDLPDEACRLLVFGGLPSGTNLQERFLWSKIAAFSLLRDRVITRFTQGVGRCTRSDNDYAVVFVIGRRLVDFLLKNENRRILNPELQAELEFGIENSRNKSIEDFKDLWKAFLSKNDDWKDAEAAILALRDSSSRHDDPISRQLNSVVADEVVYLYAMWSNDFEHALEHARKVADALDGDETKAYRAWWYYLSAEAAMALHEATGDEAYQGTARDFLKRASRCCIGVSWFVRLGRSVVSGGDTPEVDEISAIAVETIRERLAEWGAVGRRFEQHLSQIAENLQSTKHKAFHQGLKELGDMLGFYAESPEGDAAPDCIWSIGNMVYVVHEAKSEHTPGDPIGVNDVRQAQSHENWVCANRTCETNKKILCLIESPRTTVVPEAIAHAESLYHVTTRQLKEIFDEIAATLRRVRSKLPDLSDEKVLEELSRELTAGSLVPMRILDRLSQMPVVNMENRGSRRSNERD